MSENPPRWSWIVKQEDGRYTVDRETFTVMAMQAFDRIPEAEVMKRFTIVTSLNDGYIQLPPEPEEKLIGDQKKAWEKLKNTAVVTPNPYKGENAGEWMIYRMRLFSPAERRTLRDALRQPGSGWACVPNGAGMMDELEMVNFESNGKPIKKLRREI